MGKSSLARIARKYMATLHRGSSSNLGFADAFVHIVIPIAIGLSLLVAPEGVSQSVKGVFPNAITAMSIVSSLMCGLAVMVFQLKAQSIQDAERLPMNDAECKLVDELFSAILWSVVAGFTSVGLMVLAGTDGFPPVAQTVASSFACAFLANFILAACMCIKRLDIAYTVVSKAWKNPSKGPLERNHGQTSR